MKSHFDVIVLGLGGVGSAAVASLAQTGIKVLGIDSHSPPHSFGSSHGQTRIIRKAYFEHPDYVPLLIRSYELWRLLENRIGKQLYFPTGLLQVGSPTSEVITGVQRSAATYELPIQVMSMQEACLRYPGVQGEPGWVAILEEDAGYLRVEECVTAHLKLAELDGAQLIVNQPVRSWGSEGNGVVVHTEVGNYRAERLIVAVGPWASQCLAEYRLPLRLLRKHLYWYPTSDLYRQDNGFPCFFYQTPAGCIYGFPNLNESVGQLQQSEKSIPRGLKIACHSGGQPVAVPDGSDHLPNDQDQLMVEEFLERYLPGVERDLASWQGCYYTMTPDENFIVDRLPDNPRVVVVAGLSGHGFKFTSVLGEIAANLATDHDTALDFEFLGISRFLR